MDNCSATSRRRAPPGYQDTQISLAALTTPLQRVYPPANAYPTARLLHRILHCIYPEASNALRLTISTCALS